MTVGIVHDVLHCSTKRARIKDIARTHKSPGVLIFFQRGHHPDNGPAFASLSQILRAQFGTHLADADERLPNNSRWLQ